jgi:hypothetical protein
MNAGADTQSSSRRLAAVCLFLAVCAAAEWFIYRQVRWDVPTIALVASAVAVAALLGRPQPLLTGVPPYAALSDPPWRLRGGTAIALVGFASVSAGILLLATRWEERFGLGWLAVVGGVALLSGGLRLVDRRYRKSAAPIVWERWEMVAFAAVVLLGLFLRFYRYTDFPPPDGVCAVEEPQEGQGAYMAMQGLRWWEFMLDRWLPVPFWMLFGRSLTTLRIPFTIVSWLTIIPLYLLLRQLVSRPAALFATGLFAVCRWHLIYARLAHAIFGPTLPLIVTALYLCVKVHRRGGLAPYPWIGLLTGATLYGYAGYRGTPVFTALFFAISLIWHWRAARVPPSSQERGTECELSEAGAARRALRIEAAGIALAAIGFLGAAIPLFTRLADNPRFFLEATVRATEDSLYYSEDSKIAWSMRQRRIRLTSMMFLHSGDTSGTFNLPAAPQLDPVSGTLFVIGLAYCLIYAGRRFQGYFAAYFLILLFMGTIFVHNLDIRRLQGIIPLIFVMIAFAADRFAGLATARFGARARPALIGVALMLGGLAFADNYDVYFRKLMNHHGVRAAFHNRYTVGYSYLRSLPRDAYLVTVSELANFFAPNDYEWLWRTGPPGHATTDLSALLRGDPGPWKGHDLHLLMQHPLFEGKEWAAVLAERFPGTQCGPYKHPDRLFEEFWACRLPQPVGGVPLTDGASARYYRGNEKTPFIERRQPAISRALFPDECLLPKSGAAPPCRAEFEGTWRVDAAGVYQLLVQTRRGQMSVSVDGVLLHRGREQKPGYVIDDMIQRGLPLEPGDHIVEIEASFASTETAGVRANVRPEGADEWQLLRFDTRRGETADGRR